MASAKDIHVAPIDSRAARALIRRLHYSKKFVPNSQLHLGVFLPTPQGPRCYGVMSFGPSMDKRKIVGLVRGTSWTGFIELNRMAFGPELPRNSESRALGVAMRLLRKNYPQLEWVVSFADATCCGDGTIYRAAGFALTGIKKNHTIWAMKDGTRKSTITLWHQTGMRISNKKLDAPEFAGASHRVHGFQLRYIYFLKPEARARLTVPVLPFARIDEMGAGMYRGEQRAGSKDAVAPPDQGGEDA